MIINIVTYHAPVIVDLLEGDGVEHDLDHDLGEDGSVLDEGLVVGAGLLVHHRHDPLQHPLLQVQVTLNIQNFVTVLMRSSDEDEIDRIKK